MMMVPFHVGRQHSTAISTSATSSPFPASMSLSISQKYPEEHISGDDQWRIARGDFKLAHDSIKPPVCSRRFVAKFV